MEMYGDTSCPSRRQWLTRDKPPGKALQGLARGLSLEDKDSGHICATRDFSESLLREASTEKTLLKNDNKSNKNNTDKTGELLNCPASAACDFIADKIKETAEQGDMVAVDLEWRAKALQIWEAEGKPVIHLGPGENCEDLEELLANPDCLERHLKAVRAWLDKVLKLSGDKSTTVS